MYKCPVQSATTDFRGTIKDSLCLKICTHHSPSVSLRLGFVSPGMD